MQDIGMIILQHKFSNNLSFTLMKTEQLYRRLCEKEKTLSK